LGGIKSLEWLLSVLRSVLSVSEYFECIASVLSIISVKSFEEV